MEEEAEGEGDSKWRLGGRSLVGIRGGIEESEREQMEKERTAEGFRVRGQRKGSTVRDVDRAIFQFADHLQSVNSRGDQDKFDDGLPKKKKRSVHLPRIRSNLDLSKPGHGSSFRITLLPRGCDCSNIQMPALSYISAGEAQFTLLGLAIGQPFHRKMSPRSGSFNPLSDPRVCTLRSCITTCHAHGTTTLSLSSSGGLGIQSCYSLVLPGASECSVSRLY